MKRKEFVRLIEKNQKIIYETAYQLVKNEGDAWEAVSKGITEAYRRRQDFGKRKKGLSQILEVVRSESMILLGERIRADGNYWKIITASSPGEDRQRSVLGEAIGEMPTDFRTEMVLFYYSGLSVEEIASLEEVSMEVVEARLHQGRGLLMELCGKDFSGRMQNQHSFDTLI